ncbi:MAG: hypothetical protein VZR00_06740 [Lachnospiraceae bacterium]|jgi:hypothetical protein|nr:hypothetical protein [Lachnospiraceae bacterium]MEE3461571.1 hypothetical protein [Lachnospiraceae bacterium]
MDKTRINITYYLKVLAESEIIEKRLTPKNYYILAGSNKAVFAYKLIPANLYSRRNKFYRPLINDNYSGPGFLDIISHGS